MSNKKYAVLKLLTEVEIVASDAVIDVSQLEGCAGYIPVFDTIEQAEEHSADGQYSIVPIQQVNPDD